MSGGNQYRLRIKEFGDFVSEFPIRELKNIHSVDDILPVDIFDNSSDSSNVTDAGMPQWRAVQARAVLGDVIMKPENWGPVSDSSGNWELKNIKYERSRCLTITGLDICYYYTIDNSHYRLILKLGKEMQINHHSWKQHTKMSKIAKFGCEML